MTIAAFDLDHTLLAADSEFEWNKFIIEQGLVDRAFHEPIYLRHIQEYAAGTLKIEDSSSHSTYVFAKLTEHEARILTQRFTTEIIVPAIREQAANWLDFHRRKKHVLVLITATNQFLANPIAQMLKMDHSIGTRVILDRVNGNSSIDPDIPASFREGKIRRLEMLCQEIGETLDDLWAYSDSFNDIPLLQASAHPKVVCPDDTLRLHSQRNGWPILLEERMNGIGDI